MSIQRSAPTIKATVQGLRALIAMFPRPLSHHIATVHTLNHQDHDGVLKRVAIAPPMRPKSRTPDSNLMIYQTFLSHSFPYPITARKPFVSSHLHCQSILPMSLNSRTASHNRPPCTRPLCTTTSLIKGQQDLLKEGGFYENKPSLEGQLRLLVHEKYSEVEWLKKMKKADMERENALMKMEIAEEEMEKAEIDLENAEMELKRAEMKMEKAKMITKIEMTKMKMVKMKMKMEMSKIDMEHKEIATVRTEKETENVEKELNALEKEMEIVMENYLKKLQKVN